MENFETFAIRTQTERTQFDEHSTPLFLTSSFVFEDAETNGTSVVYRRNDGRYGLIETDE